MCLRMSCFLILIREIDLFGWGVIVIKSIILGTSISLFLLQLLIQFTAFSANITTISQP